MTEELDLVTDTFPTLMTMQPFAAVLKRVRPELERVFAFYAAADNKLGADKATMNVRELTMMCEDACVFKNAGFGYREMVNAFARVNIEDDLYEQADAKNTSTELVFDEFFEVLARIHRSCAWGNSRPIEDDGLELARSFYRWLGDELLPTVATAIKERKKQLKF